MNLHFRQTSQWQIPVVIIIAVLIAIVYSVHVQLTVAAVKKTSEVLYNQKLLSHASEYSGQIKSIKKDINSLDSLLLTLKNRNNNDQKNIVEALYSYADSTGLKTSKIEIGTPLQVENHKEVSVAITGEGSYQSIGKFTELIENASQPVCIRNMVIKGAEERVLKVSMDFVVIE